MFRKRRNTTSSASPVAVQRPASAQAHYGEDASQSSMMMAASPASADKRKKKKATSGGGGVKRSGSFRLGGSFRKSRPAIEVVTGSFQNVASITTDGQDPRHRQVEFNIASVDRSPGFLVERRTREAGRHSSSAASHAGKRKGSAEKQNGAASEQAGIFVSSIVDGSVVAEQRLLEVGDEIVSVNGLGVSSFLDVRDVELLLRGASRCKLIIVPAVSAGRSYVPGEVRKELFPDPGKGDKSSGQSRQERVAHRSNALPKTNGVESSRSEVATDGKPSVADGGTTDSKAQMSRTTNQQPGPSPESNASTLVDESGVVKDGASATPDLPSNSKAVHSDEVCRDSTNNGAAEASLPMNGNAVYAVVSRERTAEQKATHKNLKRRNSVLKSAGVGDHDGESSQLQDMMTVFVDQGDKMDPDKKQALLAQCLAEEFNLKFFEEPSFKLNMDSLDDL